MARTGSGRIVLEVDPGIKRELYSNLAREGITLKEWFLRNAHDYLERTDKARQLSFEHLLKE